MTVTGPPRRRARRAAPGHRRPEPLPSPDARPHRGAGRRRRRARARTRRHDDGAAASGPRRAVTVGDDGAAVRRRPAPDRRRRHPASPTPVPELRLDLAVGPGDRRTAAPAGRAAARRHLVARRHRRPRGGRAATDVDALAVSLPWLVRDALVHHLVAPRPRAVHRRGLGDARRHPGTARAPARPRPARRRPRPAARRSSRRRTPTGPGRRRSASCPATSTSGWSRRTATSCTGRCSRSARYLLASADGGRARRARALVHRRTGPAAPSTVLDHVDRALERARRDVLPGTHLVAYGHGDWNDSLQPADPDMADARWSARGP